MIEFQHSQLLEAHVSLCLILLFGLLLTSFGVQFYAAADSFVSFNFAANSHLF